MVTVTRKGTSVLRPQRRKNEGDKPQARRRGRGEKGYQEVDFWSNRVRVGKMLVKITGPFSKWTNPVDPLTGTRS